MVVSGSIGGSGHARLLLVVIGLGSMLAPLNSTMIAVALPDLGREFGAGPAQVGWLVVTYLITMALVQPIAGRLGDLGGRRQIFLLALVGFLITSIAATRAPTLPALMALRIAQATGGALAIPNGLAMIREQLPGSRLGGAVGLIGAATGLAAGLGPPLGGLIIGIGGWRTIFLANVPLVVVAVLLGWGALPRSTRRSARHRFDLMGAVLLGAWLSALALIPSVSRGANPFAPGLLAALALVALGGFIWQEIRVAEPVVQLGLFRERTFAAAAGAVGLGNLAMYATLLTIPQFLTAVLGRSVGEVGAVLAALSVPMAVLAPIAGRLSDRFGRRPVALCGSVLALVALGPLLLLGPSWPVWLLVVPLAGAGCGLALQGPAIQAVALEAVPAPQAGLASGVFSTSRYLGSIVGSAVLTALLGPGARPSDASFSGVFVMVTLAALGTTLAVATLPRPSVRSAVLNRTGQPVAR